MLGINKGCCATLLLDLSNSMQRQRRLTATLWPINLDNAPLRIATAQRKIEAQRARRNHCYICLMKFAKLHNGTVAKLFCNLIHCEAKRFELAVICGLCRIRLFGHTSPLLQEFIIPESLAVVRTEIGLYLRSLAITDLFIFI